MFNEELTAIRKAEDDSESLKRDAKLEARKMVAKAEAEKMVSDAEEAASRTYNSLIREGMDEADREYDSSMEQARLDAEKMAAKAEAKKDEVIDYIVERIVRSGVDS